MISPAQITSGVELAFPYNAPESPGRPPEINITGWVGGQVGKGGILCLPLFQIPASCSPN